MIAEKNRTETQVATVEVTDGLIQQMLSQIAQGKATFADLLKAMVSPGPETEESLTVAPPKPLSITPEHRAALNRLPEVYGKVAPTEARALTEPEQRDLIEERQTVDLLLGLLKSRKDEGIREIIANHLDSLVDDEGAEQDSKGHFLVKQDVPVQGTGFKFQRTVSEPAPSMPSAADLLAAHERGELSREQYLSLTEVPEVPRVFSEAKARKAIAKDPSLMLTLARLSHPGRKIGTIKVGKST